MNEKELKSLVRGIFSKMLNEVDGGASWAPSIDKASDEIIELFRTDTHATIRDEVEEEIERDERERRQHYIFMAAAQALPTIVSQYGEFGEDYPGDYDRYRDRMVVEAVDVARLLWHQVENTEP